MDKGQIELLKFLRGLQGKTLKWVGFNPDHDSNEYLLLFDNGVTLSITDDGLAVFDAADADLGAIVKNNYDFAKQVMELDEILNPQGRKAPAELEEEEPSQLTLRIWKRSWTSWTILTRWLKLGRFLHNHE